MPSIWLQRVGERLSYANVVATLALFIALGGASYAAVTLPHDSVGSAQLRARSVTPAKLSFPVGIATGEEGGYRRVGTLLSPSCFGPTSACSPPPPPPAVLTTVALNLSKPSQVLLLGSGDIYEPGTQSGTPDGFDVSLGLDTGTFAGLGHVQLSDADGYSVALSEQTTVEAPAGKDRFALSVSGFVSRSAYASAARVIAIVLPAAG